jgi:serine/threonine-protein kinase
MKLIEGGNLAELNAECGMRNAEWMRRAAELVRRGPSGSSRAYEQGILHRDLKPTNILLDERGEPHLTDFGLAKLVHGEAGATQTIAIVGTPGYMAPGAGGQSRQVTTAADVYSLGAILYELLTMRPPFRAIQRWKSSNESR